MKTNKDVKYTSPEMETKKEQIVDQLLSLPSGERKKQLLLEPDYPDVRNAIIEPDRITMQTWYFWKRWAPKLGPVATALFIRLRMYCYYNRQTGELRDWCYPSQTTLAQEIGLKDKKAVMRAIRVLEEHGLVNREPQYRYDEKKRKKVRTTDLYRVMMSDPLAEEDEKEIVVRMADNIMRSRVQELDEQEVISKSQKGTQVKPVVDNLEPKSQKGTYYSSPKKGQEQVPLRNIKNVNNVQLKTNSSRLRNHPDIQAMTSEEKNRKESLTLEIGDRLHEMGGSRGFDLHKSAGLHKKIAFLLPEKFVHEALTATRDAIDDQRAGRKTIYAGPAAYFSGIVRQIAEREQIDLGVEWKAKAAIEER